MNLTQPAGTHSLAALFQAVEKALRLNQNLLNQADTSNGDHGDQMVAVFQIAVQAASELQAAGPAEAMERAGTLLESTLASAEALTYAHGLRQVAAQLQQRSISLAELLALLKRSAGGEIHLDAQDGESRTGEVLKALTAGLANWNRVEHGKNPLGSPLDMGVMFEFGMAYMQARQEYTDRVEILAEAAVAASPLAAVACQRLSGVIAFKALLRAAAELDPL